MSRTFGHQYSKFVPARSFIICLGAPSSRNCSQFKRPEGDYTVRLPGSHFDFLICNPWPIFLLITSLGKIARCLILFRIISGAIVLFTTFFPNYVRQSYLFPDISGGQSRIHPTQWSGIYFVPGKRRALVLVYVAHSGC